MTTEGNVVHYGYIEKFNMSPPTKELMKLVQEEKIAHGGHPVLRRMMDNIFICTDPSGNIKADKGKSTEKIDGAIATIMELDLTRLTFPLFYAIFQGNFSEVRLCEHLIILR